MKTIRTFSQRFSKVIFSLFVVTLLSQCQPAHSERMAKEEPPATSKDQNIMLALLLDTSNSMDGLIEQAKSQLWKIVNELAAAKCGDGSSPNIKIALYEYGNDGLPASQGYIRLVSPLTDDLDLISEKLFALRTNGGNEFCGHVIRTSLNQLDWSSSKADLKMIFIAGNEPFTQGEIPYRTACSLAKNKDVVVNTIFCGSFNEGIQTDWKSGSDLTGGTYMSIEQNQKTVYISTPYDEKIEAMNDRLNDTYVYYGKSGESKKEQQVIQDNNAERYSRSNKVERTVSKSTHLYKNSTWDMVDAAKDDETVIAKTKEEDLPKEMKGMTVTERKAYIVRKAEERKKIQSEIHSLDKLRKGYIQTNTPKERKDAMLDASMLKAVKEQAKAKNLVW